jgi:hypothetical protein
VFSAWMSEDGDDERRFLRSCPSPGLARYWFGSHWEWAAMPTVHPAEVFFEVILPCNFSADEESCRWRASSATRHWSCVFWFD